MTQQKAHNEDMPTQPQQLLDVLSQLGVDYQLYKHEAIFTVAEGEHLKANIPGVHCRNLFLRDKKKNMFLIVAANDTQIDLKKLQPLIGSARLSFGSPERLWENLGVRPGSVCPYAVINDKDNHVKVILDKNMMDEDVVNYHPLLNTMTIGIRPDDLVLFLNHCNHDPVILDLKPAEP
jgi:Ala-tRNA(Pro) deacylase